MNEHFIRAVKFMLNEREKELQMTEQQVPIKTYRQGDVLLVEVIAYPADAKKLDHMTIALGEVTGHHHSFIGGVEVMETEAKSMPSGAILNGQMWVVAPESASLTHQEHETIIIDPGIYEVRIQREYEPQSANRWRNVLD